MNKIKTIVFDLDGTLVDSSRDIAAAVNKTREHFGLEPLTVNEVIGCVGSGVTKMIEKSIFKDSTGELENAREILLLHYTENLLKETVVYPGVYSLLEELDGDYDMAVATNKPLILSEAVIKGLGMERVFKVVAGPETTGKAKPEPDILEHIAVKVGTDREEVLMIGDSPVDIATAKNFGCKSCAVTWGYNIPEVLHEQEPDYVIHEPLDLLSYL